MKNVLIIVMLVGIAACSGESTDGTVTVISPPVALHTLHNDFYPAIPQSPSFSDVVSLAYRASSDQRSYGPSSLQFVEYWEPQNTRGREDLPAVILVHGGCWSNSFRIPQTYPAATAFALNGFPVWSIEYRATGDPDGGWPNTSTDVNDAIRFILRAAGNYYTQRKTVVLGHSAGGHLALLAKSQQAGDYSVIGLAAISNLIAYANDSGSCNGLARSFMNGAPLTIPQQYQRASPRLESLTESAYLFAGIKDQIVKSSQATESGLPFTLLESADHFDWIHPGRPAFEVVIRFLFAL